MGTTNKPFAQIKAESEKQYAKIGSVHCPYLNAKVHFTSEGFNHLRYSKGRERTLEVQEAKLKLIPQARILLETTTTVQEYTDGREEVHKKRYKKLSKEWSDVSYWGFQAIIGGKRLKVVVKRIEEGKHMFWSVIPVWRTNSYQGIRVVNKSRGDLSED